MKLTCPRCGMTAPVRKLGNRVEFDFHSGTSDDPLAIRGRRCEGTFDEVPPEAKDAAGITAHQHFYSLS